MLLVLLLAGIVRVFIVDIFPVKGDSMDPNVRNGDYIVVNRLAYIFSEPQRGDVVVARPRDSMTKVVKRIIGMPGERVFFDNDKIIIKDGRSDDGRILEEIYFEVRDTNKYGNLVILLNNEIIYNNITSEGNYSISIDKNFTGFVKVKAVSSGWRLWSPAIYDVNIKVIQKSRKEKDDESDFIVYDYMLNNFQQALIAGGPDIGTISLNNIQLNSTDIKKEQIVEGANRLRFLPTQDKSFKGEASIKIIYAEEVES